MNLIKIFIAVLVCASVSFSQTLTKTGTTAAPFLKIGAGSRAVGMGGAFTATADDITGIYWNPAGLANNYSREAAFNHVTWFADVNYDYAAFASHISGLGTLGTFVTVLSMDDMLVRTEEDPEGTGELFNAGALAIGVSFARFLTENFSIGFNAKYINEYIWNESASGFAVDIGTLYKIDVLNELRLAASISNFGSKMKMEGRDLTEVQQIGSGEGNLINTDIEVDEFDLPLLFRIGVAADVVKSEQSRLTLAVDAIHPNDHTEYLNTGIEYAWNELLYLRGGYNALFELESEKGYTLGVGLNYRLMGAVKIRFDYAYQEFNRLTEVHYFTVGVKF